MSVRVYPLPADDEHRNVASLVDDVARSLPTYGFPPARGGDYTALAEALETFLFGTPRKTVDLYAPLAELQPTGVEGGGRP